MRLLAECHEPQIRKSCCGEAVFYGRAGQVLALWETIAFIRRGKNRIKEKEAVKLNKTVLISGGEK